MFNEWNMRVVWASTWCWIQKQEPKCRLQRTEDKLQETYSSLQLGKAKFWVHFMEIRHEQSVISFLLLALVFCRVFADLHLWNKERALWFIFHLYQKRSKIRLQDYFKILTLFDQQYDSIAASHPLKTLRTHPLHPIKKKKHLTSFQHMSSLDGGPDMPRVWAVSRAGTRHRK